MTRNGSIDSVNQHRIYSMWRIRVSVFLECYAVKFSSLRIYAGLLNIPQFYTSIGASYRNCGEENDMRGGDLACYKHKVSVSETFDNGKRASTDPQTISCEFQIHLVSAFALFDVE